MKALILVCIVGMVGLTSYSSYFQTNKPAQKAVAKKTASGSSANTDVQEGKNLLAQSDCLACHQVSVKVVGPSYNMVADKYPATEANVAKLAEKVVNGGTGVWGQIPMSPHPSLAMNDAKKMVKYILTLKTKK